MEGGLRYEQESCYRIVVDRLGKAPFKEGAFLYYIEVFCSGGFCYAFC